MRRRRPSGVDARVERHRHRRTEPRSAKAACAPRACAAHPAHPPPPPTIFCLSDARAGTSESRARCAARQQSTRRAAGATRLATGVRSHGKRDPLRRGTSARRLTRPCPALLVPAAPRGFPLTCIRFVARRAQHMSGSDLYGSDGHRAQRALRHHRRDARRRRRRGSIAAAADGAQHHRKCVLPFTGAALVGLALFGAPPSVGALRPSSSRSARHRVPPSRAPRSPSPVSPPVPPRLSCVTGVWAVA